MSRTKWQSVIPLERVAGRIYLIRGRKVILDFDLAELYQVTTKALNQAVMRHIERFPDDFMFRLTREELAELNRSQIVTGSLKHRNPRYAPRAFTQEGIAMLSGLLHSPRAVEVNVSIMRAFVRLREILASDAALSRRVALHDQQIGVLFDHVRKILAPPRKKKKNRIGFLQAASGRHDRPNRSQSVTGSK